MCASKRNSAFTIAELLLTLALLGVLLAGLAVAIDASMLSYRENEKIATATQAARVILNRMTTEIRTAAAVDSTSTQITIVPPDDGSGLEQIQYDYAEGALYYRRTINGATASYVLLGAGDEVTVSSFAVLREVGLDWQGTPCTKSITVRLSLLVKNETFAVTASASPRRNQLY